MRARTAGRWWWALAVAAAACSTGNGGSGGGGGPGDDAGCVACTGGPDLAPTCAAPSVLCAGACTSTDSDPANCGACGNACRGGEVCRAGACACPDGETLCGDACADLAGDAANCGACAHACGDNEDCVQGACAWRGTNVEHVVLIVQENHTFDSYFGRYCTAPAWSNPSCTDGPSCCEAAPDDDRAGNAPFVLTDGENFGSDHDHGYSCEVCEIDGGAMDKFTAGGCASDTGVSGWFLSYGCSSDKNYEIATDANLMNTYWSAADQYALADRYFQPIAGGTSSNDMYFAVTHYEFADNDVMPAARGVGCTIPGWSGTGTSLAGRTTIADVLVAAGFTFAVYADGYDDAYAAWPKCPAPGGDCRETTFTTACKYDPSDIPFEYYPQFTDNRTYMRDVNDFAADISAGTLPSFAYVKYRTSGNEHPNWSYISDGETNVAAILNAVFASPQYASNTLVLLTWDEGGGFYDHVTPPASIEQFPPSAGKYAGAPVPYGARVPMLALGAFARRGAVSHVQMEHSSIVAFLEWNFLGPAGVGAIRATDAFARDGIVNNLGSMLDDMAVGVAVP